MLHRSVARLLLPLLSLVDRRPKGAAAIAAAQARILRRIVTQAAPLAVGRHFALDRLPRDHRLTEAFRTQVPVSSYGDHAALIARVGGGERDVLFRGAALALAQTSGTTSAGKAGERYIPQSKALLDHHARCGAAALSRIAACTGSGLLDGQMMMLGGSTALTPNAHGIPSGDLSGITAMRIPGWLQPYYEPGLEIALEADWERKLALIAKRCANRDVRLVSGIPSWCLMLFERICQERGLTRLRTAWPELKAFIHGGHAITPFLAGLREHLAPETAMLEVYPASEAFIGISARPWQLDEKAPPPLELLTDQGIYLEFAEEGGERVVGAAGLEAGGLYRLLLTTPAGLVRYQLGDLVMGVAPGQVHFAGRVKARISVFGEHVEGVHLDGALVAACAATRAQVAHYHVAPVLPSAASTSGRHEWWVEFSKPPTDLRTFTATLDHHLRSQVLDYDAHRAGHQLLAPELVVAPTGTFHRYLAATGKLGGQHKVPQAWNDRTIADGLDRCSHLAAAVGATP
ncbi:MAG: GH3 auxin-responsive promoter family protein [Planctomycetes bacterium]|nr:GH3 auxin-responsive promoter family protein [Planctomycetota bacterium]